METAETEARARVVMGANRDMESAMWSVLYQAGYVDGRAHAWHGTAPYPRNAPEAYEAGYAAGYKWSAAHPRAAS